LPAGSWSILPVPNEVAGELVQDVRLPVVSFTGSVPVGWSIRESVPRKHVTLELGGNAAVVVGPDQGDEKSLDWAATRIATFAMYQAGQSCISVQRVFAHRDVAEALTQRVVEAVRVLATGAPNDPATDVGPLIDEPTARRVESWVDEAVATGARVVTGGTRDGAAYAPTVLTDVPRRRGCPARRSSARSWCSTPSTRSTRRSRGSTTAGSACRPASSPATCRWPSAPPRCWRSGES
jgi:aldehyde dehydrogenase (NAD+)